MFRGSVRTPVRWVEFRFWCSPHGVPELDFPKMEALTDLSSFGTPQTARAQRLARTVKT